MGEKNYVLDTNVVLHDPNAIHCFQKNTVIIPIQVIEEIDNFKKDRGELGRNAREFARMLDKFRKGGSLIDGVPTRGGGVLKVQVKSEPLEDLFLDNKADNYIIGAALYVKNESNLETILITKDANLRIRADILNIPSEDFMESNIPQEDVYSGISSIEISQDQMDEIYTTSKISLGENLVSSYYPNQYLILDNGSKHSGIGKVSSCKEWIEKVSNIDKPIWGAKPRNKEQHFALNALMDPTIPFVTLVGCAGTGKTLLAVAAGLEMSMERNLYDKVVVARPVIPMGKDIGYLPGTLEEKMDPWMQPIFDNISLLMGLGRKELKGGRSPKELIDLGFLTIEPLTYIRGRSMPNQYILIDEAQNLSPLEVKTILTRAGEGTKVVLTGDPNQIDNPYVDSQSNGLSYAVEKFKSQAIAASVRLKKGERSLLAAISAEIL